MTNLLLAERLAAMPVAAMRRYNQGLSDGAAQELAHHWRFWARPEQMAPPGDWRIWLIMAGRGFGKTRAGAEWVRSIGESAPDARIALVAANLAEARSVMVEGPSGLLAIAPNSLRPAWEPSLRRLRWPGGAQATLFRPQSLKACAGPSIATPSAQAQKEVAHDEALVCIDALLSGAVMALANNPSGFTPVAGQKWIVDTVPKGDWARQAPKIAIYNEGGWRFAPPVAEMLLLDRAANLWRLYDGTSWIAASAIATPYGGGTVDAEERATLGEMLTAMRQGGLIPAT